MSPESDGFTLNTFGRSSATIIPITSLRAQLLCKLCTGELRFPTVRANRHRASPDARRTLRGPSGSSEPTRTPSGVRRQLAPLEPLGADSGLSRLVARPAVAWKASVFRGELRFSIVWDDATECPRTLTGASAPPNLLADSEAINPSQRTALTESLQRPLCSWDPSQNCAPSLAPMVVNARRPQTSVSLKDKANSGF